MCFSASASFTTGAILIPTGIYCLNEARQKNEDYLPIASLPLFFGIQQSIEGLVWLNIISGQTIAVTNFALCFLFFSHFFWLFWIPFAAFLLEDNQLLKNILKIFTITGFIYGALLYFPLLVKDEWLEIEIAHHSINYITHFFFSNITPENFSFYIYALIIMLPFIISSQKSVNILGILIILGALLSYFVFLYAFISVWCFMAAVVSLYLAYMMGHISDINFSSGYKD